ncbi:MAG TPA: ATP-dependent 6-phosphofructokinase, partial [Nitrospiria bacterium]|nr:ATP-dependent 6-phosphofructokinase [Nitrospiria bacterium]
DVGGIIGQGGTILRTARCTDFKTESGPRRALRTLHEKGVDCLVVIGGNGSQAGAFALASLDFPVVGIASTIDNDLIGSDVTIGVDTALNIALEAIDRLRITAASHRRAFLVEVMGRDCGYLALTAGITGGAEVVVIPENPCNPETVADELRKAYDRGKSQAMCIVAEGAPQNAADIASYFKKHHERIGFDIRVTQLGHVQRGGVPGAFDRLLATRFGAGAVESIQRGETGVLVGLEGNDVIRTPLSEVVHKKKPLDFRLLEMARILAL